MIVCICHRISDRDIARAAQDGCASFDALQDDLCVATACGACHDCARSTFEQHAEMARCPQAAASSHATLPYSRITVHARLALAAGAAAAAAAAAGA